MPRRKSEELRVSGPYYDKSREGNLPWKVRYVDTDGGVAWERYASEAQASKAIAGARAEIERAREMTVEQLVEIYIRQQQKGVKNNRSLSIETARWRLGHYFGPVMKMPASGLTERLCRELREGRYRHVRGRLEPEVIMEGIATRKLPRTGKPATVTSQLNMIGSARTFTKWATGRGHLKEDPMSWFDAALEPEKEHGRVGQSKLSFSQAEKVLLLSLELAEQESGKTDIGTRAAAVFLTLMTGLRASTVVGLRVENIDRRRGVAFKEPWILNAPQAKKRGRTRMRPYGLIEPFERILGPLCGGQPGDAFLFPVGVGRKTAAERAAVVIELANAPKDKGRAASARRQAILGAAGTYRQEVNRWRREMAVGGAPGEDGYARQAGKHWRDWLARSTAKICVLAGVPVSTAHALRGALAGKLAADGFLDVAQWLLNHVRPSTTEQSYAGSAAVGMGKQASIWGVVNGGRQGVRR